MPCKYSFSFPNESIIDDSSQTKKRYVQPSTVERIDAIAFHLEGMAFFGSVYADKSAQCVAASSDDEVDLNQRLCHKLIA